MTINFESIKEILGNIVIDVSNSFKIITELRHRLNNQNDFESVKNDLNDDMRLRIPLRPDIGVLSNNFKNLIKDINLRDKEQFKRISFYNDENKNIIEREFVNRINRIQQSINNSNSLDDKLSEINKALPYFFNIIIINVLNKLNYAYSNDNLRAIQYELDNSWVDVIRFLVPTIVMINIVLKNISENLSANKEQMISEARAMQETMMREMRDTYAKRDESGKQIILKEGEVAELPQDVINEINNIGLETERSINKQINNAREGRQITETLVSIMERIIKSVH